MAQRIVTTSFSNNTLNLLSTANALLSLISVGQRIRASDITTFNQLFADIAGHTHTWTDLRGVHTGGNLDPDSYGAGVTTERVVQSAVIGGFAPGIQSGSRIRASDVNFAINIRNQLTNHRHVTNDDQA